jgi:hypothetical protein
MSQSEMAIQSKTISLLASGKASRADLGQRGVTIPLDKAPDRHHRA